MKVTYNIFCCIGNIDFYWKSLKKKTTVFVIGPKLGLMRSLLLPSFTVGLGFGPLPSLARLNSISPVWQHQSPGFESNKGH